MTETTTEIINRDALADVIAKSESEYGSDVGARTALKDALALLRKADDDLDYAGCEHGGDVGMVIWHKELEAVRGALETLVGLFNDVNPHAEEMDGTPVSAIEIVSHVLASALTRELGYDGQGNGLAITQELASVLAKLRLRVGASAP